MSAITPLNKPPFLQQFQNTIKFTAPWCWVHTKKAQASDQMGTLPSWVVFAVCREMVSLGHGSLHSKFNAWYTFTSSEYWSILGNGIDVFWGQMWNGNQWINERDSSIKELLLKTSNHSLASRQNEGTQHNSWFIPMSLSLIKSRSKTSCESLCGTWWLVILPCAPATLPRSGIKVFWGQNWAPSCSCRGGRKPEGKRCTVQPC